MKSAPDVFCWANEANSIQAQGERKKAKGSFGLFLEGLSTWEMPPVMQALGLNLGRATRVQER